jgi:ketosteroid isomerase-like protein
MRKYLYINEDIVVMRRRGAMSAQNVAVVRSVYENFAKGDIPLVLAALDPEIEWIESEEPFLPWAGTHRGPSAVAGELFARVMSCFDQFAVVPDRIHDAGDQIVVEGRATGTTKACRKLDAPAAWVWTVRQGKAVRNMNYHDTNAFRQALGA